MVTIQWMRCNVYVLGCDVIAGATSATYTPTTLDLGFRLTAGYTVKNRLGEDAVWTPQSDIVLAARRQPPTPHNPRPPVSRPPVVRAPSVTPAKLTLGPFRTVRTSSLAIRHGRAVIDTGRSITCARPGAPVGCVLSVTARPSGASARLRGAPDIAGAGPGYVIVPVAARAKVTVTLNRAAYRLLRVHRKLTLSISAALSGVNYRSAHTRFTLTLKAPPRRKR